MRERIEKTKDLGRRMSQGHSLTGKEGMPEWDTKLCVKLATSPQSTKTSTFRSVPCPATES